MTKAADTWYALCRGGLLVNTGKHADWDTADAWAETQGYEVVWLVRGDDAQQWADTINL